MRTGRFAVIGALLLVSCARQLPPPGGPVDAEPPVLIAVSPDSASVGVARDAPLQMLFSEAVDKTSIARSLWVTPGGVVKPKIKTQGERVTVELGSDFPPDTTIGVLLTTGIRDRRRGGQQNAMARPRRWIFSTGDSVWAGRITGTVTRVGNGAARGLALIGLYDAAGDTVPDALATRPLAVTQADEEGAFRLEGLPVDGKPRWLIGLLDRDGDGEVIGTGEFASAAPDSIRLTPDNSSINLEIRLVDPLAPGEVQGTLSRAEGDSVDAWVELFEEGVEEPRGRIRAGPDGAFVLRGTAPGVYRPIAFCDLDGNGTRGPEELQTPYGDLIIVRPGETSELGTWSFPSCSGP